MSVVVKAGTKVMFFPDSDGPADELLIATHDPIRKAYFVHRLCEEPKWEDEKAILRLLRENPNHLKVAAEELEATDPLVLEHTRYETGGGRVRQAAMTALKAIKSNVDKFEQDSDAEEEEQDDATPTKRARHARTAAVSNRITVNAGSTMAQLAPNWQSFLECPITQEIMNDPVIAADGQTYERRALERWLRQNNSSPLTGLEMDAWMVPNYAMKSVISNLSSTSA